MFFAFLFAVLAVGVDPGIFYVSAGGAGANTYGTVEAAQTAAREYHVAHPDQMVTVRIRAGVYYLPQTLKFDKRDSGTTYEGEGNVVLSGGSRISGWKLVSGNRYEASAGLSGDRKAFGQIYVNNERRYRPRLPAQGYFKIARSGEKRPAEGALASGYDRFGFSQGDIHGDWHNLTDVEVLPFGTWEMNRFPIASVDTATNTVQFAGRTIGDPEFTDFGAGKRFLVENVAEALNNPGEWYLDRSTGKVTYLARPGEDLRTISIIAPRLESLIDVQGATHLSFKHIMFAHSAYYLPVTGHSTWQADGDINAAITVTAGQNVVFDRCALTHTGGYGIALVGGSKDCSITGSLLADLGAGGIKIGAGEADGTAENHVSDCRIVGGGRIHPAGIGVWIGKSNGNRIERCEIADFYYSAISIGWNWGYNTTAASDNHVTGCHLHDIGQNILSDMGGVYTLGGSDGTTIENNRMHDISSFSYGGWGIYYDEGSTNVSARNNLVYRCTDSSFHQHYGKNNLVDNNILAFGRDAQLRRTRAEDHLSFTATHNLVVFDGETLLGSNWSGTTSNFVLDNNLYWHVGGKPITFPNGQTLSDWQATGHDVHSFVADPLFMNAEKNNFHLHNGSPAERIGFKPWDLEAVGPRKGALTDLPTPPITPGFVAPPKQ